MSKIENPLGLLNNLNPPFEGAKHWTHHLAHCARHRESELQQIVRRLQLAWPGVVPQALQKMRQNVWMHSVATQHPTRGRRHRITAARRIFACLFGAQSQARKSLHALGQWAKTFFIAQVVGSACERIQQRGIGTRLGSEEHRCGRERPRVRVHHCPGESGQVGQGGRVAHGDAH